MLAHFQELKAQMNKVREAERDKLTKITLESNAAIKEVKRQKDKVNTHPHNVFSWVSSLGVHFCELS